MGCLLFILTHSGNNYGWKKNLHLTSLSSNHPFTIKHLSLVFPWALITTTCKYLYVNIFQLSIIFSILLLYTKKRNKTFFFASSKNLRNMRGVQFLHSLRRKRTATCSTVVQKKAHNCFKTISLNFRDNLSQTHCVSFCWFLSEHPSSYVGLKNWLSLTIAKHLKHICKGVLKKNHKTINLLDKFQKISRHHFYNT